MATCRFPRKASALNARVVLWLRSTTRYGTGVPRRNHRPPVAQKRNYPRLPAAARERRLAGSRPAPAALLDPRGDLRRVGSGQQAQPRGAPGQRRVHLVRVRSQEDPGHLGKQVCPAARESLEFSHCGGLLLAG
jgi:hypothetical protein